MLRYGFFDSEITGYDGEGMPLFDRAESSDFLAMFISRIISDGVLAQPGDCFQVIAHEGMKLKVRPGFGIIRGRFAMDTQDFEITVPRAPISYKRIDRIILRANYLQRCCEVILREGASGANPVPPELLQPAAGDYYELCLATVTVNSNQTVITQANITDRRYSEECGIVTQVIDHLDTSVFSLQMDQYFSEFVERSEGLFNEWFAAMKDQLSEDAAGHLLKMVEELKSVKLDKTGDVGDTVVELASGDDLEPEAPSDIPEISKKGKMRDFAASCLMAVKNVRYLLKMLGNTDISKIGGGTVTGAINALNTGLSNGAASTLLGSNLPANRALMTSGGGKVAVSSVTATELGYLAGATSGIQGQLNNLNSKQQTFISWNGLTIGIYHYGRMGSIASISGTLTTGLTAYTKYTLGTIASGFRPLNQLTKIILIQGDVQAMLNITRAGVVELTPYAALDRGYVPLIAEMYEIS